MNLRLQYCFIGYILFSFILWVFTGFAYRVNVKLKEGDPMKKDFHPVALLMVPFWPFYPLLAISLYILETLLFAVFLILFTVALVAFRKPFIITWLRKIALKIGNKFLQINTLLLRAFFPQTSPKPSQ